MKKKIILLSAVILTSLVISSCDVLDVIDINFTSDKVTVKLAINPTEAKEFYETINDIDSEIKEQIHEHGGKVENIESAVISSMEMKLVSGASNFNVLKNAEFLLSTSSMPEKKIAWVDSVPADTTKLFPQHTGDNIKDYLIDEEYTITLSGEVSETFTDTIFVDIDITYDVTL